MTHAIPRLTFVSTGGDDAAQAVARDVAAALTRGGLRVAMAVVGADREIPTADSLRKLGLATGRAVHRLDPWLMPAPVLQRTLLRAAQGADLAIIIAPARPPVTYEHGFSRSQAPVTSLVYDVLEALESPVVLCTDAAPFEEVGAPVVRGTLAAADRLARHGPDVASDPIVIVLECGEERYGPAIRAAGGFEVISVPPPAAPRSPRGAFPDQAEPVAVSSSGLERLLTRARRATSLPPVIRHPKRRARARVGLVLDDCFDFYDEESLVQFEVAGADITPISALEDRDIGNLDGLIIGDGRIERHSSGLASNRSFRRAVRAAVGAGIPTVASGGGFAYLTQGLRTIGGALHPFAGAFEGHAVAMVDRLPSGHVEVEVEAESVIGPSGTRLRGFVQRSWLLRGLRVPERRVYRTVSGPPDVGCGGHSLLCTHFRPYWPSAPAAASAFVERCVAFAALSGADHPGEPDKSGRSEAAGDLGELA